MNSPTATSGLLVFDTILGLTDDERRIAVLRQIASHGGTLRPDWRPNDTRGYVYVKADEETSRVVDDDLVFLAKTDYLIRDFHERLSRCPNCSSSSVNVREICPSCGSPHLVSQPLLHHFRCGYVAPIDEYDSDERGRRTCPKCSQKLNSLGTDYESPGDHFSCRNCFASFQDAKVQGLCLACGQRTAAEQFVSEDIFAYRISPLGLAALRSGRLFENEHERLMEQDLPLYRRTIFKSLLKDDILRAKRYKIPLSLIFIHVAYNAKGRERFRAEELFVKATHNLLRNVDFIGRHTRESYIVTLPSTPMKGAEIVLSRLYEKGRASNIEIRAGMIDGSLVNDLELDAKYAIAALQQGPTDKVQFAKLPPRIGEKA
ncbi:MAG: hypothetical protein ACPGNT_00305 [Rhodospirillales bacterium]